MPQNVMFVIHSTDSVLAPWPQKNRSEVTVGLQDRHQYISLISHWIKSDVVFCMDQGRLC